VLADAAGEGAHGVVCLGDIVGYGADPVACVEMLGERSTVAVAGNHEHGALGRLDLQWFNPIARAATEWTRSALDADHQAYLDRLPLRAVLEEATLVHASPKSPEEWDYLMTEEDGLEVFGDFDTRLCFVGHSHWPAAWSLGSSGPEYEAGLQGSQSTVHFEHGRRYIVNIGSVGQPRDRDPRASYGLWDRDERRMTIRRVPYDVRHAAQKILRAGLPRALAERLTRGV
jgi:diadenosine tetraphosphatase ApaH/serine/threonine PP2A family protein phosphatase